MKSLKIIVFIVASVLGAEIYAGPAGPPIKTERFVKEHQDLKSDLLRLNIHKQLLMKLKQQTKADRKAGNEYMLAVHQKAKAKMRADIRRDKEYVQADKKDLKTNYKLAIQTQKEIRDESWLNLVIAKQQLNEDKKCEKTLVYEADSGMVASLAIEKEANEIALADLEKDFYRDVIAIDKDINRSNAQFVGITMAESGYAYVGNYLMR